MMPPNRRPRHDRGRQAPRRAACWSRLCQQGASVLAMILELECGFANPERAAVADPEPKPREAADGETAVDRAGSSSETKARESDPAAGRGSRARGLTNGQTSATRGNIRGAQTVAAQSTRARAVDSPPVEVLAEHRQQPLGRPFFTLSWDSRVVILPDRPAAPRRYPDGSPARYWDDLNARADHGSPGMPPRADDAWRSPTVTALALAI